MKWDRSGSSCPSHRVTAPPAARTFHKLCKAPTMFIAPTTILTQSRPPSVCSYGPLVCPAASALPVSSISAGGPVVFLVHTGVVPARRSLQRLNRVPAGDLPTFSSYPFDTLCGRGSETSVIQQKTALKVLERGFVLRVPRLPIPAPRHGFLAWSYLSRTAGAVNQLPNRGWGPAQF